MTSKNSPPQQNFKQQHDERFGKLQGSRVIPNSLTEKMSIPGDLTGGPC